MPGEASEFARDHVRRIEDLERFVSQHGTSISTLVENQGALIRRVEGLEALAHARAITEAREDERDKVLYSRLDRIESEIDGIKGIGTKALWIFGGAFLTALAAFIIKGGLV